MVERSFFMYNNYRYPRNFPMYGRGNRFVGGGFLAPFILGGITGGLTAPLFYPRPFYPPYYPPFYPPFRPY